MKRFFVFVLAFVGLAGSVAQADVLDVLLALAERENLSSRPIPPGPPRPERPTPPSYPNRPDRPERPYPGEGWGRGGYGRNLICNSVDRGHEEHWRGHSTCGECLAKHGQCIETCSRVDSYYSCQFEGQNDVGRREIFVGEDMDRRYAEQSAENRCYRAGYRFCRYLGCDSKEQRQVVSRQYCVR